MYTLFPKIRLLIFCLVFSILVHFLFMYVMRMFGTYDFSAPVNQPQAVMVELPEPAPETAKATPSAAPEPPADAEEEAAADNPPVPSPEKELPKEPKVEPPRPEPEPKEPPAAVAKEAVPVTPAVKAPPANPPKELPRRPVVKIAGTPSPIGGEFLSSRYEKLTYAISLLGMAIGSAELESKNEAGVTTITLRVRSNVAISSIFPVDDLVETNQINGQFIVTKIRQSEGSFRSDEMFTINLHKKSVSWMDLLHNRSLKLTVPTDDVLDTLSGIYSLRNRPLQLDRTETLHIFDSETYAEVPVEIVRREEMRLPNLTKVNTIVVRPVQKTAGIFRRTGELLIWLTDDDFKVPVRIVTSVAVGKVTAELVSAESKAHEDPNKQPSPKQESPQ